MLFCKPDIIPTSLRPEASRSGTSQIWTGPQGVEEIHGTGRSGCTRWAPISYVYRVITPFISGRCPSCWIVMDNVNHYRIYCSMFISQLRFPHRWVLWFVEYVWVYCCFKKGTFFHGTDWFRSFKKSSQCQEVHFQFFDCPIGPIVFLYCWLFHPSFLYQELWSLGILMNSHSWIWSFQFMRYFCSEVVSHRKNIGMF